MGRRIISLTEIHDSENGDRDGGGTLVTKGHGAERGQYHRFANVVRLQPPPGPFQSGASTSKAYTASGDSTVSNWTRIERRSADARAKLIEHQGYSLR